MPYRKLIQKTKGRLSRGAKKFTESFFTGAFKKNARILGFLQDPRAFSTLRWKNFLKHCFVPQVFYDIGANNPFDIYEGQQTLYKPLMPNTKFFLFEAMAKHEEALIRSKEPYAVAVLGERDGETKIFYETSLSPAGTGDSYYIEKTKFYEQNALLKSEHITRRLDSLVAERKWPLPDFIKLDTQGSELDILRGGPQCLAHARGVQIECNVQQYNEGAPLLPDVAGFMRDAGFGWYDITQFHFDPNGELRQADMVFLRPDLLK